MTDASDENKRSIWCGNLSHKVTEDLLYELFLQAGPVVKVTIPKDYQSGSSRGFAFILFSNLASINYAVDLLNGISLYDRKIVVKRRNNSVDEAPPQAVMPQEYMLNISALTPVNQPFNVNALTPVDHSFMPLPMNMPFGNSMFNLNPLGNMPMYPSQMNENGPNQGDYQNKNQSGFDSNWNSYNQNRGNYDRNQERNHDGNYQRNQERNYDRSYDRGNNRDFKRNQDRDFNRNDGGRDRNQDRGYGRNNSSDRSTDRDFDRSRNRRDRDFGDRSSSSKHSSRDFNRYERGNGSSDRNSSEFRKRDHSSSDYSSRDKRRRR